tara:strand:- start:219 stop:425 length:207 start_codon:yes stop_codon:yes gene_type:complete
MNFQKNMAKKKKCEEKECECCKLDCMMKDINFKVKKAEETRNVEKQINQLKTEIENMVLELLMKQNNL